MDLIDEKNKICFNYKTPNRRSGMKNIILFLLLFFSGSLQCSLQEMSSEKKSTEIFYSKDSYVNLPDEFLMKVLREQIRKVSQRINYYNELSKAAPSSNLTQTIMHEKREFQELNERLVVLEEKNGVKKVVDNEVKDSPKHKTPQKKIAQKKRKEKEKVPVNYLNEDVLRYLLNSNFSAASK